MQDGMPDVMEKNGSLASGPDNESGRARLKDYLVLAAFAGLAFTR